MIKKDKLRGLVCAENKIALSSLPPDAVCGLVFVFINIDFENVYNCARDGSEGRENGKDTHESKVSQGASSHLSPTRASSFMPVTGERILGIVILFINQSVICIIIINDFMYIPRDFSFQGIVLIY